MRCHITLKTLFIVFVLLLTANVFAEDGKLVQCEESDITLTDQPRVKEVFATGLGDNDLLQINFGFPTSIDGAAFSALYLAILGKDDEHQLLAPLSTVAIGESLESGLLVSQSRYKDYTLIAHYFPETGCPTMGILNLNNNHEIEEFLSCVRDKGWVRCVLPESVLKKPTHK